MVKISIIADKGFETGRDKECRKKPSTKTSSTGEVNDIREYSTSIN